MPTLCSGVCVQSDCAIKMCLKVCAIVASWLNKTWSIDHWSIFTQAISKSVLMVYASSITTQSTFILLFHPVYRTAKAATAEVIVITVHVPEWLSAVINLTADGNISWFYCISWPQLYKHQILHPQPLPHPPNDIYICHPNSTARTGPVKK